MKSVSWFCLLLLPENARLLPFGDNAVGIPPDRFLSDADKVAGHDFNCHRGYAEAVGIPLMLPRRAGIGEKGSQLHLKYVLHPEALASWLDL